MLTWPSPIFSDFAHRYYILVLPPLSLLQPISAPKHIAIRGSRWLTYVAHIPITSVDGDLLTLQSISYLHLVFYI